MVKNCDYVLAAISSSIVLMFIFVFVALIGQFILPFGFSETNFYGTLGTLNNGIGIVGSVIFCLSIINK